MDFSQMYDLSMDILDELETLVSQNKKTTVGMKKLICICESYLELPVWERLRKLDYNADVKNIENWIKNCLKNEPPQKEIDTLLFNSVDIEDEEILKARGYNIDDGYGSCSDINISSDLREYQPENNYANSSILKSIEDEFDKISSSRKLGEDEEGYYFDTIGEGLRDGYITLAVNEICRKAKPESILVGRDKCHVGIGVVVTVLGTMTKDGWDPDDKTWPK